MEIIFIFILSILILILVFGYYMLKTKRLVSEDIVNSNFKYPQGRDCKLMVNGETLKHLSSKGKYVVIVTGDSLNPDYSNGDFVIISRILPKKIKRGQYILIKNKFHKCIVKICTVHRDGTWTAICDEFKFKIHKEEIGGIIENKIRRG